MVIQLLAVGYQLLAIGFVTEQKGPEPKANSH
jgi:hypothetical protein